MALARALAVGLVSAKLGGLAADVADPVPRTTAVRRDVWSRPTGCARAWRAAVRQREHPGDQRGQQQQHGEEQGAIGCPAQAPCDGVRVNDQLVELLSTQPQNLVVKLDEADAAAVVGDEQLFDRALRLPLVDGHPAPEHVLRAEVLQRPDPVPDAQKVAEDASVAVLLPSVPEGHGIRGSLPGHEPQDLDRVPEAPTDGF
mmetsp:Transcript_51919/g.151231  ORF Transcript_51919/g.151231 Transcript_51919/m.151231 type:complete len:201 (-) Transcript_51919:645-1247(-)